MEMLETSNAITQEVSNKTLEILALNKSTPISQLLPENIKIAGKTGGMPGVRCETAIIYLNKTKYALTVMTSLANTTTSPGKEYALDLNGTELISKISYEVFNFFNVLDNSSKFGQGLTQTINY